MVIGKTKTKAGAERVELRWYATHRATGQQYVRRSIRMTVREYNEMVAKIDSFRDGDCAPVQLEAR